MKNNTIFHLAKKEFALYINGPLAYTVIVPFLLLSIFIYIRTALIGGVANLRPYFELLPWFLLLLAPAISMKLLTDEHRSQTIELLYAHPISELQIVLGKFLGALTFFVIILLTTISLPITLLVYSRPDIGQIVGQYIGALFVGATFISIGLAASTYVKNAVSSFLIGAAVSFVFLIIGLDFITQSLPFPANILAQELSVITHGDNIARGLLDIRDVFYFLSVSELFLALSIGKLSERKIAEVKAEKTKLSLALGLIVAIGVVANVLLSYYPLRLDLTQARLFTLSAGTRETIRNLPDIVTVTVYRSRELPAQMQLVARDITDLLKDYEKISRNLKTKVVFPQDSVEARSQSQAAGIQEVQFNSIATGKFEVQAGILGLAIRYGDKTESMPFVADTADLEYQLTRRIRKLTQDKERTIGIIQSGFAESQLLSELASTQYRTETLTEGNSYSPQDYAAVILIDGGSGESTLSAQLARYLERGGAALVMASGVSINPQLLSAQKSASPVLVGLKDYGVTINNDLVYDLQLSETLAFSSGDGRRYLAPYPYWLRALPVASDFAPLSTVKSVSLGWVSSLTLTQKDGVSIKTLLATGSNAGRVNDNFEISPQSLETLIPNAKNVPLAASSEKGNTRLVVVGTDTVASDQFLQNNPDNATFVSNIIDYLAGDRDLAAIPSKTAGRTVFEFNSPADVYIVQYGNLIAAPLGVIAFAIYHLRRRRLRTRRTYVK